MAWVLIDCNNFYVSCERVFRPDLRSRPVMVLSSDQGCVVARSSEVKAMGVQMGQPRFQLEELIKQKQIQIFTSNFPLYTDLSRRVMTVIAREFPQINLEIYSIDECFVPYEQEINSQRTSNFLHHLKKQIWQEIGIPVTVGLAPTKTQAKLIVDVAKSDPITDGVIFQEKLTDYQYLSLPVQRVWGIGQQLARQLLIKNINTVGQLMKSDPQLLRKEFGLSLERIIYELRGIACIQPTTTDKQGQICRSRSLDKAISSQHQLLAALAYHLEQAVSLLRHKRERAGIVGVYLSAGYHHRQQLGEREKLIYQPLTVASNYLPDLMKAVKIAFKHLYQKEIAYKKVGVILAGLEKDGAHQPSLLFSHQQQEDKHEQVMNAVDKLNEYYGQHLVRLGNSLPQPNQKHDAWKFPKANLRSNAYTTNWQQLALVF